MGGIVYNFLKKLKKSYLSIFLKLFLCIWGTLENCFEKSLIVLGFIQKHHLTLHYVMKQPIKIV